MLKQLFVVALCLVVSVTVLTRFEFVTAQETPPAPEQPKAEPVGKLDPKMLQIKGKAFLPDGAPANGMSLLISGRSKDSQSGGTGGCAVDSEGNFARSIFANAEYMISIFDPKGKWAAPSQFFTVKEDDEYAEEIVFHLEEGIRIVGKVVDETTGEPIPDIELSVSFYNEKAIDGVRTFFKSKSDEKGEYGFAASPADEVYVNIGSLPIYRGMTNSSMRDRENVAKLLRKVSFDGQSVVNIDFRIPSPFVGKVLHSDGSPAAGANVQMVAYRPRHADAFWRGGGYVETDKNGFFRLTERPRYVCCTIWARNRGEIFTGWFDDDLPKEGEKVFQLQRACRIQGRLIDAATKKPMADQLLFTERSSADEPKRLDFMPLSTTRTNTEGFFDCRVFIAAGVRHELFVVPDRQKGYGGVPSEPRVTLTTVIPEEPGQVVDVGDLEVDPSKVIVPNQAAPLKSAQEFAEGTPEFYRQKMTEYYRSKKDEHELITSGKKKAVLYIVAAPEAKESHEYILKHAKEGLLADCVVLDDLPAVIVEQGKTKMWQEAWDDFKESPLYLIVEGMVKEKNRHHAMLAQLRGEEDSPWNVPQDDPSNDGDWKKSPGMLNPKILDNFLNDYLEKVTKNK